MVKLGVPSVVLNLIITGIPSIQLEDGSNYYDELSFKPYYNWNTFNTLTISYLK